MCPDFHDTNVFMKKNSFLCYNKYEYKQKSERMWMIG